MKSKWMKIAQNTINIAMDTMGGTRKSLRKMNWGRNARNASSIAGTIGSALFLARTMRRGGAVSGMGRLGRIIRLGGGTLAMIAGGMKVFDNYAPDQSRRMQKSVRKSFNRYKKRVAF